MACYLPFNSRNLEISLFVFRPMVVLVDELVEALKHFSVYTESLGCIHSAIFRSIHGNMIIWHGAWMKRSDDNKELLLEALLSTLTNVSSMAILVDHNFFDAFAGESRDGPQAATFFTGDTISLNSVTFSADQQLANATDVDEHDFTYACLAIFKDRFLNMEGANAGVCMRSQTRARFVSLVVWKSLHCCYSYLLNYQENRKAMLRYLDGFCTEIKYDVFRVVFVSGVNHSFGFQFYPSNRMLGYDVVSQEGQEVVQDLE